MGSKSSHHPMTQSDLKTLAGKNTFYNYVGRILEGGAHFLISILLARHLTISDYGQYSLFMEILKVSLLFGGFGIGAVFLRYLPEMVEKQNFQSVKALFFKGTFLTIFLQLGVLLIFLLSKNHLAFVFKTPLLAQSSTVLALLIFALSLIGIFQNCLTGMLFQREANFFGAGFGLLKLFGIFIILREGLGLEGIFKILIGVNTLYLLTLGAFLFSFIQKLPPSQEKTPIPKNVTRYGLFAYFNETTNSIFEISTDIFIIGIFLGSEQVAQYAFAAGTLALLLNWLPTRISSQMLLPLFVRRISRVPESQKREEIGKLYTLLVKLIGFFLIPGSLGLILLGEDIIRLVFDPKFLPAYTAWAISAAFLAINEILVYASVIANLKERSDITFYSRIFIVYNLALDLILVKSFGIEGVAFATATALFGKGLLIYLWTNRLTPLPLPFKALAKTLAFSLTMGLGVLALKMFFPIGNIFTLMGIIIGGALIFLGLCYRFKIFSSDERTTLGDTLRIKYCPF